MSVVTQEKAILVISGKAIEQLFDLSLLDAAALAINRSLAERDVLLTRRIVTLSPERADAAPFFLKAGFEASPADDEDMQAAAIIFATLGASPVDEVVFALGDPEPTQLMRLLAGKTRRVLLSSRAIDENFAQNIERALDARELLSKEGVSWKPFGGGVSSNTSKDAALTKVSKASPQNSRTPSDDALCQTSEFDPFDDVKAASPEWNLELEQYLLENGKRNSAYLALQSLEPRYPGITQIFKERRGDFQKMLDPSKARLIEDTGVFWFYHPTHSEMAPVDPSEAATNLMLAPSPGGETASSGVVAYDVGAVFRDAKDFDEVMERIDVMVEQCEWSAERAKIVAEGGYSSEDVKSRDLDVEAKARASGLFLWPIGYRRDNSISSEDYLEIKKIYAFLKQTLALVSLLDKNHDRFDQNLAGKILQIGADSQCLLKTKLRRLGVSIDKDPIQRDAFKLLMDARAKRFRKVQLNHMKLEEEIDPSKLPELEERFKERRREAGEFLEKIKAAEKAFDQVKYLSGKLQASKPGNDYEFKVYLESWTKIVDAVTVLCRDYREPPSSPRLRELLVEILDDLPDEVETTDEFARVRQSVDLVRMEEKEGEESEPEREEESYSEEIVAVRRHYGGSRAVFIGGVPQEHIRDRLERTLDIKIDWDYQDHGDSLDHFARFLNAQDVKLFLVYIPWCSHKHSRELQGLVQKAGKDFVRLRKGTNPRQIAVAICDQVNMTDDDFLFEAMNSPDLLEDDE